MTVINKVKTTLATAKSVRASLELFSLESKDDKVQKLFSDGASQIDTTIQMLQDRIKQLEYEEPQYRQ